MNFSETGSGLYLFKPNDNNHSNREITNYSILELVDNNQALFTRRQIDAADQAKQLYQHLGMPGYRRFFRMLQHNHIANCPVTLEDAKRALTIYGPDIAHLKGKGTRLKAGRIEIRGLTPQPRDIINNQKYVNLSVDYFYIQGLPVFLHTISPNFQFRTVEFLMNKRRGSEEDMKAGVKRIVQGARIGCNTSQM